MIRPKLPCHVLSVKKGVPSSWHHLGYFLSISKRRRSLASSMLSGGLCERVESCSNLLQRFWSFMRSPALSCFPTESQWTPSGKQSNMKSSINHLRHLKWEVINSSLQEQSATQFQFKYKTLKSTASQPWNSNTNSRCFPRPLFSL